VCHLSLPCWSFETPYFLDHSNNALIFKIPEGSIFSLINQRLWDYIVRFLGMGPDIMIFPYRYQNCHWSTSSSNELSKVDGRSNLILISSEIKMKYLSGGEFAFCRYARRGVRK
jgi:hypothetical protein